MDQAIPLLVHDEHDEASLQERSRPQVENEENFDVGTAGSRTKWTTSLTSTVKSTNFWAILPHYVQPGGRQKYQAKRSPTSYLDALRGYAAFLVYIYHCWDLPESPIFQFHFLRVPWIGGAGMVAIFFVISGYVLSFRIVKLIRNEESAKLLDTLASSIFRRFLRLYLATGFATFVSACFVYVGWFVPYEDLRQHTVLAQLSNWFGDFIHTSNPFADIQGWIHPKVFFTRYLAQMWTIPVEYRGSIVIFIFCTAACKLTTRARLVLLWIVIFFSYYWRVAYVVEFMFGVFIAELSLVLHPERHGRPALELVPDISTTQSDEKELLRRNRKAWAACATQVASYSLLILGWFLLGQPEPPDLGLSGPWPWQYLHALIPTWYGEAAYTFWPSIAACCVVLAIDLNTTLQRPFEWSFSQYLGDLSFGIYAMHIILIHAVYKPVILVWQKQYLGDSTVAYIPGAVALTLLVFWAGDYFSRVDKKIVQFGRWLQAQLFVKWE
ncbi:hypothetical protein LTR99_010630 [Exophiala xenobiotica]|uniref:Acyltransferase 3 domain-containing protein n=1 Tax=Vermiconidia calcicola TaxID=1690605 RepID=A0AAV9Q542_9PEZI|nr:hypothetical protein LTR92_007295 [Exophiala xenobiotica]KAK5533841.1 hypothetical protein LTR25_006821 [Vermiconidia calcicola]KAK5546392.1 hypothetical protein LTR23_003497 [Chaetothyriales sp. CCFEE 6169]KAK5272266.1 hypothetical protein LTR96_001896 [Exophiala xenobiotica]KAK5291777.1 hypothetical protein LTR99_010630 [Exophiala xenobiotica]